MFMTPVSINGRPLKRPLLFFIQYCADCNRFTRVSQLGNPCKRCGSTATANASTWSPLQMTAETVDQK
ncbi:MAG: hypothetical protein MI862_22375 [Desulfobacterales bacterium]|nr:hypothetical protein [Desulfobacterales bacterium]